MRRVVVWVVLTGSACGGDSGSNTADGDRVDASGGADASEDASSDGGSDAGVQCTDQVCFFWENRGDGERPATEVEDEDVIYETCNILSLLEDTSCPNGFHCGDPRTIEYSGGAWTFPLCTPDVRAESYVINIDLSPTPTPSSPVQVTLHPTMGGNVWPAGDPDRSAGRLTITSDAGYYEIVDLPIEAAGTLQLELDPGTYNVRALLQATQIDTSVYPVMSRSGTLIVNAEGSAEVPFDRTQVAVSVLVDEEPVTIVGTGELIIVAFWGYHGQFLSRTYSAGSTPSETLAIDPDTYLVRISTLGPQDGSGLHNTTQRYIYDPIEISGAEIALPIGLETVNIAGTVVVNSANLPAASNRGVIRFESESGVPALEAPLNSEMPAGFQGSILTGTYRVVYDAGGTSMAGVPAMAVEVMSDYHAGDPLALDLPTVAISGEVTLNGAPVAGSISGLSRLNLISGETESGIVLPASGARTFNNVLIFDRVYDVSLGGFVAPFFLSAWSVQTGYDPSTTPIVFNVNAHPMTITMTVDGTAPPDATGSDRGSLIFLLADDEVGVPTDLEWYAPWPLAGTLTYTTLMPDARWRVAHNLDSFDYDALPGGAVILSYVDHDDDYDEAFDVSLVEIGGTITMGGVDLPDAAEGKHRGTVRGESAVLSSLFSPNTAEVALTGPATYSVTVYEGPNHLWLTCSHLAGCDDRIPPFDFYAYHGLDL